MSNISSKVLNRCVESIYLNTSSKIEVFSSYEASLLFLKPNICCGYPVSKIHVSMRLLTKTKVKTDRKENIHNFRLIFCLSGPLMELENFISILGHLSGAPLANSAAFHLA